jgi:transposase-like protein
MSTAKEQDLTLMQVMQRSSTEDRARAYFESIRWPNGPFCQHCGNVERIYKVTPNAEKKIRRGLYKCAECKESFTVTVGTVMEDSHIPINKWLVAFYLMCASKMQIPVAELQRHLKLGSYKSAWSLCKRIRLALREIEPDSTAGERITGTDEATPLLNAHVSETARLNIDGAALYKTSGKGFAFHDAINQQRKEHSRHNKRGRVATTNTAKSSSRSHKRSVDGTPHQERRAYSAGVTRKYNTRSFGNGSRTASGIRGVESKRFGLRSPKGTR